MRTLLDSLASPPWGVALIVFVLVACEPNNPPADTTTSSADEDTTEEPVTDVVSTPDLPDMSGLLCLPDRHFCNTPRESAQCSTDGKSIAETTPCLGQTACDPNTGLCAAAICEPDSTDCISLHSYQKCNPDGSGYGATQACDDPMFCAQGRCRACTELEVECLSDTTFRRCAADASAWSDPQSCQSDYRCAPDADSPGGAACKECGFERVCLTDSKVRTRCTSGEVEFQEDITCGVGTTCMDGYCRACEPSLSQCLSETSFRACAEDGSAWSAETPCPAEQACFVDKCLPYGCSPRVLLLVDYSGSMSTHWETVAKSVADLVAQNPEVRFGLKTFPDESSSCEVGPGLTIPFATDQATTFAAWFETHDPPGATPLAAGIAAVADNADTIFGPLGGYMIVLSDGEDSCYFGSSEMPIRAYLATVSASLHVDHNVQVYGIAYAFGGGEAGEMDTIAKNGGTGDTEAIDAGNEDELSAAFDKIIDKVKFCEGDE